MGTWRFSRLTRRGGQAYVETLLAVLMISLLFFGLFQVALLFNAREVLFHSAHRAARARSVGFNRWMVEKVMRVAAIPNAGAMRQPDPDFYDSALEDAVRELSPGALWDLALGAPPPSVRGEMERARVPDYLAGPHSARARAILDYADWGSIHWIAASGAGAGDGTIVPPILESRVQQRYPLMIAMHRLFYAPPVDADGLARIRLSGRVEIENQHALYLEDRSW